MFNKIISGKQRPKYLSTNNDPLFKFHQWRANLRIIDVEEIKSVPYTPTSHRFVERLIGSVRGEFLDQMLFWNTDDLQNKLNEFQASLDRVTPARKSIEKVINVVFLDNYRWKSVARGLFNLPIAA